MRILRTASLGSDLTGSCKKIVYQPPMWTYFTIVTGKNA